MNKAVWGTAIVAASVGLFLGAQVTVAQLASQPVYLTNRAGVEQALNPDAQHGSAVKANGPQLMGACDDVSTVSVSENQAGRLRIDCTRLALLTEPVGLSVKRYISAGSSQDKSQVKATAGVLIGVSARNAHATTAAFLKCTNLTSASTTPGSSTIFYDIEIPPAGVPVSDRNINAAFDTALTCYLVTDKTDAGTTSVGANDVNYNLTYQ